MKEGKTGHNDRNRTGGSRCSHQKRICYSNLKNPRCFKTRLTDLENELMVARGEDGEKGRWGKLPNGVWDLLAYITIFKMDNQQGPTG